MSYWDMMDFNGMMGYGGWWFAIMAVFWLLLLVALVLAIFWLYRNSFGAGKEPSATEIAKRRYAKGEITKKEYEEKMKDLGG